MSREVMSTTLGRQPATPARQESARTAGRRRSHSTGLPLVAAVALGFAAIPPAPLHGQDAVTPEVAQIEAVAEALLRGISESDAQLLDQALHPAAYLMAVPDEGTARRQERAEFIQNVGDSGGRYLERMWEPRTEVSGPVATVWAPYDFYVDGQFSHCGIDAFQLIRQDDRWVILSVVYTMRRGDDCEPSPLGPPGS